MYYTAIWFCLPFLLDEAYTNYKTCLCYLFGGPPKPSNIHRHDEHYTLYTRFKDLGTHQASETIMNFIKFIHFISCIIILKVWGPANHYKYYTACNQACKLYELYNVL